METSNVSRWKAVLLIRERVHKRFVVRMKGVAHMLHATSFRVL